MKDIKPNVIVSKCLGFANCRYNGQVLHSDFIEVFKDFINFIPVCPEVEIGLGIPRNAIRIVKKNDKLLLLDSVTGEDHTNKMDDFAKDFLSEQKNIDGFVLKTKSPSCGVKNVKIYKKIGKVPPITDKTKGKFSINVEKHFPYAALEDDGRLRNYKIRENFLIQIFTLARFRKIHQTLLMKDLVEFHSRNKYLFMAYSQTSLKKLGKITANHDKLPAEKVFQNYREELDNIFINYRKDSMNSNALLHMFGYFKEELNKEEKDFFLRELEKYKKDMSPLSVPLSILKTWVLRFNKEYLKKQTILNPYPDELRRVTDSGKGRI